MSYQIPPPEPSAMALEFLLLRQRSGHRCLLRDVVDRRGIATASLGSIRRSFTITTSTAVYRRRRTMRFIVGSVFSESRRHDHLEFCKQEVLDGERQTEGGTREDFPTKMRARSKNLKPTWQSHVRPCRRSDCGIATYESPYCPPTITGAAPGALSTASFPTLPLMPCCSLRTPICIVRAQTLVLEVQYYRG